MVKTSHFKTFVDSKVSTWTIYLQPLRNIVFHYYFTFILLCIVTYDGESYNTDIQHIIWQWWHIKILFLGYQSLLTVYSLHPYIQTTNIFNYIQTIYIEPLLQSNDFFCINFVVFCCTLQLMGQSRSRWSKLLFDHLLFQIISHENNIPNHPSLMWSGNKLELNWKVH